MCLNSMLPLCDVVLTFQTTSLYDTLSHGMTDTLKRFFYTVLFYVFEEIDMELFYFSSIQSILSKMRFLFNTV